MIDFNSYLKKLWHTPTESKYIITSRENYISIASCPCDSFFEFKTEQKEIVRSVTSLKTQLAGFPDIVYKICPYIVDMRSCIDRIYADDKRISWLSKNATGLWYHCNCLCFRFELEEDAVLFRLTFS